MKEFFLNMDWLWILGMAVVQTFVIHTFVQNSRTQDRKQYLKQIRNSFIEHHRTEL
jgi:hypothetical protein